MNEEAKENQSAEERILEAARRVFFKKGYNGARMQEIADEAGINKALLHYYFRSKEKLFEAIYKAAFAEMLPKMMVLADEKLSFEEKIKFFFENHIQFLLQNPFMPAFIIQEINQNPEMILNSLGEFAAKMMKPQVLPQLIADIKSGKLKPVNPAHYIVNMLALSIFPMLVSPLLKRVLGMSDSDFIAFMEERKQILPEFYLNGILQK